VGTDPGARGVLNIGKVLGGKESYYLDQVARSQQDYYTGAGEAPGLWMGTAATELGIAGEVSDDGLRRVLAGAHPDTAARLTSPPRGRRVAAFDLTFRAPKSVSLLYGLGELDVTRQVRHAHETALAEAIGYLERHAAVARRGHGGRTRVDGIGFLAAAFQHRSSRLGDPLLHHHVLVANYTRGPDGRWTALDGRVLFAQAKTAGYLYQAALRRELTRRLGVAWQPVANGVADIAGVPRQVIEAFSKRRRQITTRLAERGEHSAKAAQVAALDTRPAKQHQPSDQTLRARWRREAGQLGFTARTLERTLAQARPCPLSDADSAGIIAALASPDGLTAQASTFTRRDVVQAVCERLPAEAATTSAGIEQLVEQFLRTGDLVCPVAVDPDPDRSEDVIHRRDGTPVPARVDVQRYATHELLALEARTINAALARQAEGVGVVAEPVLDAVLTATTPRQPTRQLGADQLAMVRQLTRSGNGIDPVNARAGTGKTFALAAARAAWQASGYRVVGATLAAQAAKELSDGAGIPADTVTKLLGELDDPRTGGFAPGTVLVVDEAGMVGTRQLARLLDHAATAKAKVVLVGDTYQLPEIDAGGLFRGLAARLDAITLTRNRRQAEAWEREALDLLAAGDPAAAMHRYQQHSRVVVDRSAGELRSRLVADWWAAVQQPHQRAPVMIAARRADVADLNGRARALMAAAGRLGPDTLVVGDQEFAVGDRVVALRNDRRLGVRNGTRGTVTAISQHGGALEFLADDGRAVRLPRWYLSATAHQPGRRLDHGYAITGHKAEGMTTERAFVLGSEELYKEWGYTAMSRGRLANRLYLCVGDNPLPDELDWPPQPNRDPVAAVVQALGRSRAKTLALDHLPSAHAEAVRLPSEELRARVDRAAQLLQQRPQLSARTSVAEVRREQARLRAYQREEQCWITDAEQRLAAGRLRRAERHELQAAIPERRAALTSLDQRLQALAQRLAVIDAERTAQATWDQAHAQQIGEALVYGQELSHRDAAAAAQLEHDPPRYLVAELGGRPTTPAGRTVWQAAATRIGAYRAKHHITDPNSALGPVPTDPARQLEHATMARMTESAVQAIEGVEGPSVPAPHPDQLLGL
jgi:conjugative relaxase-like TrwC/TraI family protein